MSDPYLSADLPGTGGSIKEGPDDFRVEEIPLYEPCGEGEHLYIKIEKTGLTTHQLLRRAARAFSIDERDIGYAGLKDSRATTIQTISVPLIAPERAGELEDEQIRVISAIRHRNKLRTGHLAGNRFAIRLAAPGTDALEKTNKILALLQQKGVPNYFGEQRYGALGNSHRVGRAILQQDYAEGCRLLVGDPEKIEHPQWRQGVELFQQGKLEEALGHLPRHCHNERQLITLLVRGKSPEKALLALPRNMLRLYLSAYQSSLFDRIVAMRLATIDRVWPGDIAIKHVNGACFRVEDAAVEQPRAARFEISATGPLYGHKLLMASGQSGILEESLLDKEKLSLSRFNLGKGLTMPGERRPLRVPIDDASVRVVGADLHLAFSLPKGSYATSLLREIVKTG